MRKRLSGMAAAILIIGGVNRLFAAAPLQVVADLLQQFGQEKVSDALSVEIRNPASAGKVKKPALFEHPKQPRLPAKVNYKVALPNLNAGEALLFSSEIAISDGVKLGAAEDGVEFVVEVNGQRLFSRKWKATKWNPVALDLSGFAGKEVELTLVTDAIGNTSYDWALWGEPRVYKLGGRREVNGNSVALDARVGVIALGLNDSAKEHFFVLRNSAGKALEEFATSDRWVVRLFELPPGEQATLEAKNAGEIKGAWVNGFEPFIAITQLASRSAITPLSEPVELRCELVNIGEGDLLTGQAELGLQIGGAEVLRTNVPALVAKQKWEVRTSWRAQAAGDLNLNATVSFRGQRTKKSTSFYVDSGREIDAIESGGVKLSLLGRDKSTISAARALVKDGGRWVALASWYPLTHVVTLGNTGVERKNFSMRGLRRLPNGAYQLAENRIDGGNDFEALLEIMPRNGGFELEYSWKSSGERQIISLGGPNIYVGDGTTGAAKTWGLFPGLEYLYKGEPSSNVRDFAPSIADRRTPHPNKVTIPFMAITVGPESSAAPENAAKFFTPDSLKDFGGGIKPKNLPSKDFTVALSWDTQQKWDGVHGFPSPRFSSPNFDEGMENHRLALFLPSVPDFVPENASEARKPVAMKGGQRFTLRAILGVTEGDAMVSLGDAIKAQGGLPKPNALPRNLQAELDVSREGFLKSVWDSKAQKFRHCVGWAPTHAPGLAALLWLDSLIADSPEKRKASRERAELEGNNVLREQGAGALTSQAAAHIMQWEFPFLYGHLPEAMQAIQPQVSALVQSRQPNGGWVYQPGNAEQAELGQAGDSVLGTCANRAALLLRFARITGDQKAWDAGRKALLFMRQFKVPRGGQTWECPMYEPDILAAAYAVRAYHDAYRITGDIQWLREAVYWAETGVPFVYLWSLPEKPMMLGATIPVFGSTFYTHTWLATPVQWCGLVYSYHVFHLAEELQHLKGAEKLINESSLKFRAEDWVRLVELITVSGTHQQFAEGDKIGAYPDSISNFEKRNPAFINPEDILVNVLALSGHDPDLKTVREKKSSREVIVTSEARLGNLAISESGAEWNVDWPKNEKVFLLVKGINPKEIKIGGAVLPRVEKLSRDIGWSMDENNILYICVEGGAAISARE